MRAAVEAFMAQLRRAADQERALDNGDDYSTHDTAHAEYARTLEWVADQLAAILADEGPA